MRTIYVTPAPGLIVRNPGNGYMPLPPEGMMVPLDIYWYAHERDGAVTISDKAPAEKKAKAPRAERE
jgi:hypothetical protein